MARQFGHDTEAAEKVRAELLMEEEENEIKTRKIKKFVMFGLLGVGCLSLVINIFSSFNYKNKLADAQVQLQESQAKLTELQESIQDSEKTVVTKEVVSASAKEAGEAVCQAQNDLNTATKAEQDSGSINLSDAHQEALTNLRKYILSTDGNSQASRKTWCLYGVWSFDSVYEYEGTKVDVVWTCYNSLNPDRLLAYAIGTYNSNTNTFSNMKLSYTSWYDTYAQENGAIVTPNEGDSYTGGTDDVYDANGNIIEEGSDEQPTTSESTSGVSGSQTSYDSGDAYTSSDTTTNTEGGSN